MDTDIGEDASELFNSLSGFSASFRYRKLAVAPITLRQSLLAHLRKQTNLAQAGKPARIFAKLNALVDPEIIRELYRASRAGVPIELVCAACVACAQAYPGSPSASASIHSSDDFWNTNACFYSARRAKKNSSCHRPIGCRRNLDRRVEVLFPVTSEALRARIRNECLLPEVRDELRIYEMTASGAYQRHVPSAGQTLVDAQLRTWGLVAKAAKT